MKEEINFSLQKLQDALSKLREGVAMPESPIQRDGVIQRFEFTYELLWKTLKLILQDSKGLDLSFPKEVFRAAFKAGLILDESTVAEMLVDRNITTHVYNEDKVTEIFLKIKARYCPCMEAIVSKLNFVK